MSKIENYLFFDGNCAEAMRFYESALGGKLNVMQAKDSPDQSHVPPGGGELVLHARLDANGAVLMASDWMDTSPYPGKNGFAVTLAVPTLEEAKSLFEKLSAGGEVTFPLGKTFYSEGFAMFADKFGVPWMVITESK